LLAAGCGKKDESEGVRPAQPSIQKQITTKTGIEMALIPAGEFVMGDDAGEDDEKPAHRVQVSAFYMDTHEVTQKSYEQLMGKNPSKSQAPEKPVEQVSWYSAIKYCNMRSMREGLEPCYNLETQECNLNANGYRLPTEAEWEYACRAGTDSKYYFGNDPRTLSKYAWFKENSNKTTHPVAQKEPNPWGLYDMCGNVAEWCHDFYSGDYYQRSGGNDPSGPSQGKDRVLRGGGWNSGAESCRSSARFSEAPGFADVCFGYDAYGFRCVRRTPPSASKY
jgi:formylglycine-generating enzyme required for sulfatase activity